MSQIPPFRWGPGRNVATLLVDMSRTTEALPRWSPGAALAPLGLPPEPASPLDGLATLEADVRALREAMFAVNDSARQLFPYAQTAVHVRLQSAANQFGEIERMLRDLEPGLDAA